MNSLLFGDYVRRHTWLFVSLGTITAAAWFMALTDSAAFVQGAMAASISIATMTGLFVAKGLAPMEVQVLPISRREMSRTLWWASIVLPAGVMTTGKVIGSAVAFGRPVHAGPEAIWLSAMMDFVSMGTMLSAMMLLQHVSSLISSYRWQAVVGLGITLPVLTAPFVLVFLHLMPLTWRDIGPAAATLIAVGAVCTALVYAASPQLTTGNRRMIASAMASQRRSGFWLRLDRVTGLRRMVFQVWRSATTSQILTPALIALMGFGTTGLFEGDQGPWEGTGWMAGLREFGFLPFEPGWEPSSILMLFMLGSFAFAFGMESGVPGAGVLTSMRHIRTLPLSTRQLNGILLALSFMVWVNSWLVLAGYHWLVTGEPPASFRLAVFLGLFGLDCLNKAAQLRYGTRGVIKIPAFVVLGLVLMTAVRTGLPLQPTFLTLGVAGLVAAWFVNQHTLTTRRKIYTPQRYRPFGMEIPGQS